MLNVPLVYVRGNHDAIYGEEPPEGCEEADGNIVEVTAGSGDSKRKLRVLGLGGSMRYNDDSGEMYTEDEMRARIRKAERAIKRSRAVDMFLHSENGGSSSDARRRPSFDILLTHAPCRGYGDMEDLPHRGFECFNQLLDKYGPKLHCYGHIHQEYGGLKRKIEHPSGTLLINGSGHQIIDID